MVVLLRPEKHAIFGFTSIFLDTFEYPTPLHLRLHLEGGPYMGPLSFKLARFTLIGLVGLVGLAGVGILVNPSPANAANVICEGDCSELAVPDFGEGSAFDPIVLGVESTTGDRRLRIATKGDVYLVGPISTTKKSMLKALNIIVSVPAMIPENIKLKTRNLLADFPSVVSRNAGDGDIRTRIREKNGNVRIKSNGDLYIDISETDLLQLKIKAKGFVIVSDERLTPITPVPEPSTAILMALGLAGLSTRRFRG